MRCLSKLIEISDILQKAPIKAIKQAHQDDPNWWEERHYKVFKEDRACSKTCSGQAKL